MAETSTGVAPAVAIVGVEKQLIEQPSPVINIPDKLEPSSDDARSFEKLDDAHPLVKIEDAEAKGSKGSMRDYFVSAN